ncbi:MAG: hypothetical protein KC550_07200 [Nanoarchaeota archaeon]|nr:hypothetical protein [Nanoarchaeota archaeon]
METIKSEKITRMDLLMLDHICKQNNFEADSICGELTIYGKGDIVILTHALIYILTMENPELLEKFINSEKSFESKPNGYSIIFTNLEVI